MKRSNGWLTRYWFNSSTTWTGRAPLDVSTVLFGLDGLRYEIDLTGAHAQHLRESLADFIDSARRVGGRIKRGAKPPAARDGEASKIRKWAQQNDLEVGARGRVPQHVVEAYKRADAAPRKPAKRRTRVQKR